VFVVATVPSADLRLALSSPTAARPRARQTCGPAGLTAASWFTSSFAETLTATSRLVDDLRQRYVLAVEAAPDGSGVASMSGRLRAATVKAGSAFRRVTRLRPSSLLFPVWFSSCYEDKNRSVPLWDLGKQ
jgi:hypothetical protein